MTLEALTWAMSAPAPGPVHRLALIGLADDADPHGFSRTPLASLSRTTLAGPADTARALLDLDGDLLSLLEREAGEPPLALLHLPGWQDTHRDYLREHERQQTREAAPRRRTLPQSVRRQVWDRDGWRCVYCGEHRWLTVDHIVPVILGGSDDLANLATCCQPCNSSKGAAPVDVWLAAVERAR